jgi:4-carboxymuconolactone decarboxylase
LPRRRAPPCATSSRRATVCPRRAATSRTPGRQGRCSPTSSTTSARASNADFIWNGHVRLGLQAGTREEALHAVDTHGPLDGLTADEALIIRFGRELLESPQVSDATFNAVRARYGEKGLLELTAVMSVYTMNAAILRVMDHQAAADARHLTPR